MTHPGAIDLDDTELEPSDVERGEWQAGTRDYVERLEVVVEALRARVVAMDSEARPLHESHAWANLGKELITASDGVIDSGRRMRSDPGSHELALANLCAVMAGLAKLDALGKEEQNS